MAEDNNTPNPQRPIGIKPITIKPMQPPAKAPEAPATDSPVAAAPASPAAIKPITITPSSAPGKTLDAVAATTTIRLKPVVQNTGAMSPSASAPPPGALPPQQFRPQTIQPPSIKPSIHPPLDSASKSKTSRISLDSAFGETTTAPSIHIGSASTAPVGKITSNLTADSLSIAKGQTAKVSLPLQTSESEITRRRTLRVKSPTQVINDTPEAPEVLTEAPTVRKRKTLVLKKDQANSSDAKEDGSSEGEESHVSAFSAYQNQPVEKTNPVFPVLAVAAMFMIVALAVMYMAQACGPDRSLTAFSTFPGMSAPNWPGKINSF